MLNQAMIMRQDGALLMGKFVINLTNLPTPPNSVLAVLNILMKHVAPFTRGELGTYRIIISNQGEAQTNGPVNVNITLPESLTFNSFSGGWTSIGGSSISFQQSAYYNQVTSYPTLVVNVNVSSNAP